MTQFRALPVRRGDALLLTSRRGTYLIDGGDLSGQLPAMLRERRVGKLRAAVCTFPSPERLGGILDLLADGYPLRECWLPARIKVLQWMARGFNGDWKGWFALAGGHEPPAFPPPLPVSGDPRGPAAVLLGLALAGHPDGPALPDRPATDPGEYAAIVLEGLIERSAIRWRERDAAHAVQGAARTLCRGGGFQELVFACGTLILDETGKRPVDDLRARITEGLAMTAMASALVANGLRVRYFRTTAKRQGHLIPRHPLMCLNGMELKPGAAPPKADPASFFRQAGRLSGTGRGLVFQYGDARCGVLFCGNSSFSFAADGPGVILSRPMVVAAPGQGGVGLEAAYGRITSLEPDRDVWVRTHFSHARKIAHGFSLLPNTLCLSHCVHRSAQEVVLQFGGGRWHALAGRACAYT